MRKFLLPYFLIISFSASSQTNEENLKSDIENIKNDIKVLKIDIQSVKSENIYLKQTLQLKKPILEQQSNNNQFTITKVIGNRKDSTILINLLVEAIDENKTSFLQDFSIIDLQGNEYKVDYIKSSNIIPKLSLNVPIKVQLVFKDIIEKPQILKTFRFSSRNEPERNSADFISSKLEFRDLFVSWD